jgi:hypothetical protein
MTIKELIKTLKQYDQNMIVCTMNPMTGDIEDRIFVSTLNAMKDCILVDRTNLTRVWGSPSNNILF